MLLVGTGSVKVSELLVEEGMLPIEAREIVVRMEILVREPPRGLERRVIDGSEDGTSDDDGDSPETGYVNE